ncbi:MAG: superoxide dismutase family protein [Bacteriovoracia bacterium]
MKTIPLAFALFLVSCASNNHKPAEPQESVARAAAEIHSPDNTVSGLVTIQNLEEEIKFKVLVKGLKPNSKHGFHIHQNGVCEGPDYKSAGDHLNPYDQPHGAPMDKKSHLGDLGNLEANKNGVAEKEISIPKHDGDAMEKILGKAFIIHAGKDDLKSQPSGDAGSRIACGIIQPSL